MRSLSHQPQKHHQPIFVGLDYHKKFIQVCIIDSNGKVLGNRRCDNHWLAIAQWTHQFGQVKRVAIEACNGAANLADELIQLAGWTVELAHPGYVHRMKGSPDKTDYSDARLLADLTRTGYLPKVWLAPEHIRELRRLVRYRQQLVNEYRSVKLRIRGLLRDHRIPDPENVRPWTKAWLAWVTECDRLTPDSRWIMDQHLFRLEQLSQLIHQAEQRLRQVTHNDKLIQLLTKQSGIGPQTAYLIRAEIGRFDRFKNGKQLARFCGLSPRNASSGQRQADAGLIRAGNGQLRAVIIEAAWRLIQHDPYWKQFAAGMRKHGKPGSVIAAAVANRWLRNLYHIMKPMGMAA